jgi:hypothetical protein
MTLKQAIEILEAHNAWRRGEDVPMIAPEQIGQAIDVVVSDLYGFKNEDRHEEMLIAFLVFLHGKKLIDNHFDFQKKATEFLDCY